jgi:heme ABC exporter ATP-binding subunit CcmA
LPEAPLLEARGVVRRFGRTTVLAGVDLTVGAGEVLLLLGPNGAGKSTLLRTLAGLARPDAGTVRVRGEPVREGRAHVGHLAHDTLLYDDLTVGENLAFAARLYGLRPEDAMPRALAAVGAADLVRTLVRHLSRGQAQRVALARALLHDPAVLLLDEPFTGLDPRSTTELTALLVRYRADGKAVVFVGHQPELGWEAVTRVAVLARGGWRSDRPRPANPAAAAAGYREATDG